MTILHICDHPPFGGAFVASQSVVDLVGGHVFRNQKPGRWIQSLATIGGYCSRSQKSRVRKLIVKHRPDVVHLHNFKEFGTAAIAAAQTENVPVVWSCYDYWPLCPRDNFHGPDCVVESCRIACYNPRDKILPTVAKLPLLGRKRRFRKWMNRLDSIVALSANSRQLLLDGGVGSSPEGGGPEIHVIPLPITLPRPIVTEKDPNLVVFVGGSPGNKGKNVFFEAEKLVKEQRPDVYFEEIKANSREGALEAVASAQVLMVPELWPNPGPVVVVEAALLGTNVVTSDVGGIKETAQRYGTVGLAHPDDPSQFADEILHALDVETEPGPGPDLPEIKQKLLEVYQCAAKRA